MNTVLLGYLLQTWLALPIRFWRALPAARRRFASVAPG